VREIRPASAKKSPAWAFGAVAALLATTVAAATPLLLPLTIGGHVLRVEIVDTDLARQQGLMHRDALPADRGMLFVYAQPLPLAFWMKNTKIPLDIAFLADDGAILQIEAMTPYDETHINSKTPVRLALEVNHGWFAEHGVRVGDRVRGLPVPRN
jgi:uncharacterized membrane protein (UPF0127 family)